MWAVAVALLGSGLPLLAAATYDRRRRWRQAEPFVGDERGAPEPVLVPNGVVYLVYLGGGLAAAGLLLLPAAAGL